MTALRWAFLALAMLATAASNGRLADAVAPPLPPPGKRIALSFDDVPRGAGAFLTAAQRDKLLIAGLKRAGVRQVVLYVNPGRIRAGDGNEARIADYVRNGAVIANHTWSHPHLSSVSAEAFLADVYRADAWLKGRPGYRPWLRFPFLDEGGLDHAKRDAVRLGMAVHGIKHGYATVDGSDWHIEALSMVAKAKGRAIDQAALRDLYVETMVQAADFANNLSVRELGRSPPHVLLLHETDLAALFIDDLIKGLRADGWRLVSADEAYADPIYQALPDIKFANGTLPGMLAWVKNPGPPRWYERNDMKVSTDLFVTRVLHDKAS